LQLQTNPTKSQSNKTTWIGIRISQSSNPIPQNELQNEANQSSITLGSISSTFYVQLLHLQIPKA
jgi:hypothetical protein